MDPWDNSGHRFTHPLRFADEPAASNFLEDLLLPHFALRSQIRLRNGDNILAIDYVAIPRPHTQFPFPFFGVEVKPGFDAGHDYNKALNQCCDYALATVEDPKKCPRHTGQRLERVYLFPGLPDDHSWDNHPGHTTYWLNRFAGKRHVGVIYREKYQGAYFAMCADRQWSARDGPINRKHNVRHLLGSGVPRR